MNSSIDLEFQTQDLAPNPPAVELHTVIPLQIPQRNVTPPPPPPLSPVPRDDVLADAFVGKEESRCGVLEEVILHALLQDQALPQLEGQDCGVSADRFSRQIEEYLRKELEALRAVQGFVHRLYPAIFLGVKGRRKAESAESSARNLSVRIPW